MDATTTRQATGVWVDAPIHTPNELRTEACELLHAGFLSAHRDCGSPEFVCVTREWYDRVRALLEVEGR